MSTISVRLTVEEAIALMRVIATKQASEGDAEKRDDLEELRLRLYDKIYHREPMTIKPLLGVADESRQEPASRAA